MATVISDRKWHSSPTLNYSVDYVAERPNIYSTQVRVKITYTIRSIYSSAQYNYPLYCKNSIDNAETTVTSNFGSGIKTVSVTTGWIYFNSTGSSLNVGFTPRCGDMSHTSYDTGTITFPAYVSTPSVSISSVSDIRLDNLKVNYSYSGNLSYVQYSLNNGGWIRGSGNPITISGLNPNTSYSIRLRGVNSDGVAGSASSAVTKTTLDIAKIIDISDSEYNQPIYISFSNLSNGSTKLLMKVADIEICERTDLTADYTLTLSKEELSSLIKLLNTEETEVTYTVVTNNVYKFSKTAKIILKANVYYKKDGVWIKSEVYKKDEGWIKTKAYYKAGGTWKEAI